MTPPSSPLVPLTRTPDSPEEQILACNTATGIRTPVPGLEFSPTQGGPDSWLHPAIADHISSQPLPPSPPPNVPPMFLHGGTVNQDDPIYVEPHVCSECGGGCRGNDSGLHECKRCGVEF